MKDELEARENAGRIAGEKTGRGEGERNAKINLIQAKLYKGKAVEVIAEELENSAENILTMMKEMDNKEENR